MSEVALWYWRHGSIDYDLCDNEEDAASMAVHMGDYGEASVEGVQFPDGRVVKIAKWPAFAEAVRQQRQREAEQRAAAAVPRPQRTITAPFGGRKIEIDADEPDWLGVKP